MSKERNEVENVPFTLEQITKAPVTRVMSDTTLPIPDVVPLFIKKGSGVSSPECALVPSTVATPLENAHGKIATSQSTQKTWRELAKPLVQQARAYEERAESIKELSLS